LVWGPHLSACFFAAFPQVLPNKAEGQTNLTTNPTHQRDRHRHGAGEASGAAVVWMSRQNLLIFLALIMQGYLETMI
jgi:hypothetical protein